MRHPSFDACVETGDGRNAFRHAVVSGGKTLKRSVPVAEEGGFL